MQLEEKAKVCGGVATILFHILLLLVLIFVCFERIAPKEEDGVPLSMGMPDMGGEDLFEPTPESEVPEVAQTAPTPAPADPAPAVAPNVETQTLEQTVAVPTSKKKVEKPSTQQNAADKEAQKKKEEQRQQELKRQQELAAEQARLKAIAEAEAKKRAEEEAIKQKAKSAANVFNKKPANANGTDANSSGVGSGSKPGNQGDPNGSAGGGKGGSGNRWDLAGRQIVGTLPRPSYTANEQGYVVVNITVDSEGNVIGAEVGKCVGITASSLRNAALQAAKKAKFSKHEGRINQKGTITYNFKLQ
ncbi:MAG: cell envelope integrity protein TolA [Paludibacteraceae bacterium]|nr:cell envelope integrity protein TolA [Paludibacteraceae bacterium]